MERSHESAWGAPSPESDTSSLPSGLAKESKSRRRGSDTAKEPPEQQSPPKDAATLFGHVGREVLKPSVSKEVVVPLRAAEIAKEKPADREEHDKPLRADDATSHQQLEGMAAEYSVDLSAIRQEREVAAEVVDNAQSQNTQEAAVAHDNLERASAENVGQLLDNTEARLENAPPEATAGQIIDRTTEEAVATLEEAAAPIAEMAPLDWPQYQAETQATSAAETGGASGNDTEIGTPPWQQEQLGQNTYDDNPGAATTASYAAPYAAAGSGRGGGGQRPPHGYAAGYNPNTPPPVGAAALGTANAISLRERAGEVRDALVSGFFTGLITGGIIGHWLGRRGERTRAARSLTKQERLHQEQVKKYEKQVAESQDKIRTLTERQAYAAHQALQAAAETGSIVAPVALAEVATKTLSNQERAPGEHVMPAPTAPEARQAEIKTNIPKRVEQMTDNEVHEASRDVKIGNKTLYELKENGTVTTAEERKLLRLVEQGSIEDPVRKYHFDQEVQRVLMRHELDPLLAQQVLQRDLEALPNQSTQPVAAQPYSISSASPHDMLPGSGLSTLPQAAPATSHDPAPHSLVVANIIAGCILVGLVLVLIVVSIIR